MILNAISVLVIKRITGELNPIYTKPFVFKNDFSALLSDTPSHEKNDDPLFKISTTQGESRVICFSPDHSKTLPQLTIPEIELIIRVWQEQVYELNNVINGFKFLRIKVQ